MFQDHEEESIEGPQEETEEVPEETVMVLDGKIIEPDSPDSQDMSITIDLETGSVSGIIYIRVDKEDIKFDMDVPLTGSIDRETREIVMTANELTMTGTLSPDGKSASGNGSDGIVWSAVRKDFN